MMDLGERIYIYDPVKDLPHNSVMTVALDLENGSRSLDTLYSKALFG